MAQYITKKCSNKLKYVGKRQSQKKDTTNSIKKEEKVYKIESWKSMATENC
jgi:hypothetical protein